MSNYLYNGIELPKLPEWDKTIYPYAYITLSDSPKRLILSANEIKAMYADGGCVVTITNPYANYIVYELVDGAWIESTFNGQFMVLWCSVDLYYSGTVADVGGTLYLAASDPVPVLSIDHTAMVQGWIVGKRLAAQRAKK